MESIKKTIQKDSKNYIVYYLKGELSIDRPEEFKEQIVCDNITADDVLVLELSELVYIDSWGLGELINLKKDLESKESSLIIANPSKRVSEIFTFVKLVKFFNIQDDLDTVIL